MKNTMGLSVFLACIVVAVISIHAMCVIVLVVKHKIMRKRTDDDDASSVNSLPFPPGPLRLPFIGNALYFFVVLRHNPHRALADLAEKYGPIVSFRPGTATSRTFVVVSSPAAAREALAKNDLAVAGRWVPDSVRARAHDAGSVFFLPSSSPLWKQHRVTIGAHVSSSGRTRLGTTRHIRERHARKLAELVRAGSGQPMAVGEAVYGTMVNAVSNILFSRDLADMSLLHEQEGQGWGPQVYKAIAKAIGREWARPNISDAFPFLAPLDLFGARRRASRSMAKLYQVLDQEVESRLASGGSAADHDGDDLLGIVLARHAKSEITRADISKLLADIFIAGTDTTRIAVEWAMMRLLRHPDKMEKVRAELAASRLGSKDKEFVEESDLDELPYLHAVVKEVMRMHPSLPVLPREVVADGGISLGGFYVPKGTCILVNLWALGRDPASWPEPEQFVPERFLAGGGGGGARPPMSFRAGGGSDFSYIPFGAGRRVCPGMDMAARFVPLVLASLLHKVQWKLCSDDAMALAGDVVVDLRENSSITLDPAVPLRAIPLFTP